MNLYYFYDSDGQMMGLRYNDVNYYPLRNLQGDVVALTDYNGNKVVEYVYDSWGKVESVTGSLKDTLGKDNPVTVGITTMRRPGFIICKVGIMIRLLVGL